MELKLIKLTLQNFKGIKNFAFEPCGDSADIYGRNGSGKTTLADAYFWLLFGKDSRGQSDSKFNVKTKGTEGLDYTVEGVFMLDGETITLKRIYKDVFSCRNGDAKREPKGNTTEYYIDDVPKPKKDYTAFVADICDEDTFALLTDPDLFAGRLKDDARRDMLIRLFGGDVADRDVINAHDELRGLFHYIGSKTVADYEVIARERRKKINKRLDDLPGRIDEAEKAKPADCFMPEDAKRLTQIINKITALESAAQAVKNGEAAAKLRKEVLELENALLTAERRYNQKHIGSAQNTGAMELRNKIGGIEKRIQKYTSDIGMLTSGVESKKGKRSDLNDEWVALNAQQWTGDTVCPTCGQELPAENSKNARAAWNENRAKRIEAIEAEGMHLKEEISEDTQRITVLHKSLEEARKELSECQGELDSLRRNIVALPPYQSTKEYQTAIDIIATKQHDLDDLKHDAEIQVRQYSNQITALKGEQAALEGKMSAKVMIDQQDKRISDLKQEQKGLSVELAAIDKGLYLAEQFIQCKATDLETKVNAAFQIVRWKLFSTQKNGGIKNCCEAMVDGISYSTNLNNAAKINAGLDIISAISKATGVSVPVWIDNAESVTDFIEIKDAPQMIRLYVSDDSNGLEMAI